MWLYLLGLYCPQQFVELGHGSSCKPLVPTLLLCDVQYDELGSRRSCKIDCEPWAMFRMVPKRYGKDNPAKIIMLARPKMRADCANGNLQTAYQVLGDGTD